MTLLEYMKKRHEELEAEDHGKDDYGNIYRNGQVMMIRELSEEIEKGNITEIGKA